MYVSELAQRYWPSISVRCAVRNLKKSIAVHKELQEMLKSLNYKPRQQWLTPLQYKAIVSMLGGPELYQDLN